MACIVIPSSTVEISRKIWYTPYVWTNETHTAIPKHGYSMFQMEEVDYVILCRCEYRAKG